MGKFSYFKDLGAGSEVFLLKATSAFHDLISTTNGSYTSFSSCLLNYLKDLDEFAINKRESFKEFFKDFPFKGVSYGENNAAKIKEKLCIESRDSAYCFTGIASKPVYVLNINVLNIDYSNIASVSMSFISANSEEDAEIFLEAYYAHVRKKNRKTVMGYRGNRIKNFRKMDWSDIYLPNTMVEDIRNDVECFFKSEQMYKDHNLDWRMGLLLAGPPGNGKTAICRAIATTTDVPVIYCALDDDVFSVIASLQHTTEEQAPCLVMMEDADSLGAEPAARSNFLNMLDGLFSTNGVMTIASTNSPERLDPAFTGRPSRFDCFYTFNNPEFEERKSIFTNKLGKSISKISNAKINKLIKEMEDLSAAAVQEVAVKALRVSFRDKSKITPKILEVSLQKVKKHMSASEDGIEKLSGCSLGFSPGKSQSNFGYDDDDDY